MKIYCDGGARGNPGPASWAVVVENGPTYGDFVKHATNNEMEYQAVIHALDWLLSHNVKKATIHSDSKLIVEQVNGRWKVKTMAELCGAAKHLMELLGDGVKVIQIPRAQNRAADKMVNKILDANSERNNS